jgi:hypothetical protein
MIPFGEFSTIMVIISRDITANKLLFILQDPILHGNIFLSIQFPSPEGPKHLFDFICLITVDNIQHRWKAVLRTMPLMLIFRWFGFKFLKAFVAADSGMLIVVMSSKITND